MPKKYAAVNVPLRFVLYVFFLFASILAHSQEEDIIRCNCIALFLLSIALRLVWPSLLYLLEPITEMLLFRAERLTKEEIEEIRKTQQSQQHPQKLKSNVAFGS